MAGGLKLAEKMLISGFEQPEARRRHKEEVLRPDLSTLSSFSGFGVHLDIIEVVFFLL